MTVRVKKAIAHLLDCWETRDDHICTSAENPSAAWAELMPRVNRPFPVQPDIHVLRAKRKVTQKEEFRYLGDMIKDFTRYYHGLDA